MKLGTPRVCFALLWICCGAVGPAMAADWLVPGVINGADGGNHWATELRIHNRGVDAAQVRIRFLPAVDDSPPVEEYSSTVEPGAVLSFRNLLRELWQLEDRRGALWISVDGSATMTAFRHTDEREAVLTQALVCKPEDEWISGKAPGEFLWLAETAEFRSGLWLAAGREGSRAEVVILDEAGVELARTEFRGEPRSRWVPLADLGVEDRPLVRAQVRFVEGAGAATCEVLHLPTGDRMSAGPLVVERLQTDLSVQPVWSSPSYRTSARIYNPASRPLSYRLSWNGRFVDRTLEPGALVEVADVAADLKLEGEQRGLLRISSLSAGLKIAALARLSRVAEDGSAGPGELLEPEVTIEFGGAPNPWLIQGVPANPSVLLLGLRGGFAASESQVRVFDQNGAEVAAAKSPLAVAALGSRVDDLGELTGTGSLPESATVRVDASTGLVAPMLLAVMPGSGDVLQLGPSRTVSAPACALPQILSFLSDKRTLAPETAVTLSWRTNSAAGVRLSLDGELREANGSFEWTPPAGTLVRLTAINECGESSQDLSIAVGSPAIMSAKAVSSPQAGEGSPGQLVQFTFGNLAEPSRVTGLVFRAEGVRTEVEVEAVDPLGRVYALVPYIWTEGAQRYWRGDVSVGLEWDGVEQPGGIPFRILPLPGVEDPVAGFRQLLASLKEMAEAARQEMRRQGLSELADAQAAAVAASQTALEKSAAEIAASGRSTLFFSTATSGENAVSATVTAQDLADLMGYETNLRESNRRLRPNLAGTRKEGAVMAAEPLRDAGTCLAAKEPFIPICKALNARAKLEAAAADRAAEFVKQFLDGLPSDLEQKGEKAVHDWVKTRLAKIAVFGLMKRLQGYLNYLNIVCLVRPLELDEFSLTTVPPRRTTSALKEIMYSLYDNQPTLVQVNAVLRPAFDSTRLRDELVKKEAKYIVKQLNRTKVPAPVAEWAMRSFLAFAQGDAELQAIEATAKALNFKQSQSYQVGKCDLVSFFPWPGLGDRRSAVRVAAGYVQGEDNFYYLGSKINSRAKMCIEPKEPNFIFSERVLKRGRLVNESSCPFSNGVVTRGARVSEAEEEAPAEFPLPEFNDTANVGPGEGLLRAGAWAASANNYATARPAGFDPVMSEVRDEAPWAVEQRSAGGAAGAVVRKTGRNKWTIEAYADGQYISLSPADGIAYKADLSLTTSLAIPDSKSGTYTLKLDGRAEASSGVCGLSLALYSAPQTAGGNNGAFVSTGSPRVLEYSVTANDRPGPAGINVGLVAYPTAISETHKVACRAKGTIELTLPDE